MLYVSTTVRCTQKEETVSDTSLPIRDGLKHVRREVENMAVLLDDACM